MADLVRVGRFGPVAAYQWAGYACGALLVASGLFHAMVYLVDGGGWEGPLSWRKPIVFGLSFGLTVLTVTWFMSFLRPRRVLGWLFIGVFSLASVAEVALISMQTWRGVPSHFNESTTFDSNVFGWMGMLVSVVVLLTVLLTAWSFVRIDAPRSLALAIRLGLVILLVGQGVGVQMIAVGGNTFGAHGALKVPHALTLHAIQVLPALALLLLVSDVVEEQRVRLVALGAVGYGLMIAATMVEVYGGHAPLRPPVTALLLAVCGLAVLLTSVVLALRGLASRSRHPDLA